MTSDGFSCTCRMMGPVAVEDETDRLGCLGLWGPESRHVLGSVTDSDLSNAAFPYMTGREIQIKGAFPSGPSGSATSVNSAGSFISNPSIARRSGMPCWQPAKNLKFRPPDTRPWMRCESKRGIYIGAVISHRRIILWKPGMGMFVDLDKNDFIGRQSLLKIKEQGLESRLVALTMDAGGNLYGGESVRADGRVVGRIRTGNYGYTIAEDIGLVYLPLDLATAGTELTVEVMGEQIIARVAETPLVDPAGAKLRA